MKNEIRVSSRDVSSKFNRRHDDLVRTIDRYLRNNNGINTIKIEGYFIESSYKSRGKDYKEYLMNINGVEILLNSFKYVDEDFYINKKYFEEIFNCELKTNKIILKREEFVFEDIVKKLFSSFNIKIITQYSIGKFRIDFYIKELNLAIEFDEWHHKKKLDEDRENEIRKINKHIKFYRIDANEDFIESASKLLKYVQQESMRELFYHGDEKALHWIKMLYNIRTDVIFLG